MNIRNLSLLVQAWRAKEPDPDDNTTPDERQMARAVYSQCADELEAALAQQTQPDYRCVMCNKPLPVGCKDCTEYAYDAVGYPVAAPQPEPEDAPCEHDWFYEGGGVKHCRRCGEPKAIVEVREMSPGVFEPITRI